jgi:hypothetical protein
MSAREATIRTLVVSRFQLRGAGNTPSGDLNKLFEVADPCSQP